jgi:hypothetical protein
MNKPNIGAVEIDFDTGKPIKRNPPEVRVMPEGQILLGHFDSEDPSYEELWQAEAIQTALRLVVAVQKSIDRNQIGTPSYNDTENILRRQNAPLGRALQALLDTNFDGVRQAWINS